MDVVSDAISSVRIGRPQSNRLQAGGSWCVRIAPYDGAGFHVALEGSCRLLPDGGDPVSLGPGDAVLLPHGTGHVITDSSADAAAAGQAVPLDQWLEGPPRVEPFSGGKVEMLCGKYRLDRSRVHPLLAELPTVIHLPRRIGGHPQLHAAIDLLGRELQSRRAGRDIAMPGLLDLLLVYMLRAWMVEADTGIWMAVLKDSVTAAALRAMHSDPAASWTNAGLAAESGVSRPTLARRFTALVGQSPMSYLTWWRLTRAAALLRDTPDSLATISRQVGYGSPYAFSHAFKRQFGVTPGRYRTTRCPGRGNQPMIDSDGEAA